MSQLKDRQAILNSVVADQLKKDHELPMMSVGDTIDVHYRIIEGTKERIQVFQGVLPLLLIRVPFPGLQVILVILKKVQRNFQKIKSII